MVGDFFCWYEGGGGRVNNVGGGEKGEKRGIYGGEIVERKNLEMPSVLIFGATAFHNLRKVHLNGVLYGRQ